MYNGLGLPAGAVLDPAATLGWRMARPGEVVPLSAQPVYRTAPAVTYQPSAAVAVADDARRAAQIAALAPKPATPTPAPIAVLPVRPVAEPVIQPTLPSPVSQGTTPTPSSFPSILTTPAAPAAGTSSSATTAAAIQAQPIVLPGAAGSSGAAVTPASTTDGSNAGFSLASLGGSASLPLILAVLALSFLMTHKQTRRR
jgi:hypothetical protein